MQKRNEINRRSFIKLVSGLGAGTFLGSGCKGISPRLIKPIDPETAPKIKLPLRLHSNENPYGPSPRVLEAFTAITNQHRYTDDRRDELREVLANRYGLKEQQVLLGCGSIEMLKIITDAFCSPEVPPVIAEPVYEAIDYYASLKSTHAVKIPLTRNLEHDLDRMAETCTKRDSLVYICNPSNPIGNVLHKKTVKQFLDSVPEYTIVAVDEAYDEYVRSPEYESCIRYVKEGRPNIIVLRTFSKIYGLAGLRVGYALGPKSLIGAMSSHRLWNDINQAGAAAALAALEDMDTVWMVRRKTAQVRSFFYERAKEMNVDYIPSETSFVMLKTEKPSLKMIDAFRKHQVLVGRRISSFPNHVRVSLGTKKEMQLFFAVLEKIMK